MLLLKFRVVKPYVLKRDIKIGLGLKLGNILHSVMPCAGLPFIDYPDPRQLCDAWSSCRFVFILEIPKVGESL